MRISKLWRDESGNAILEFAIASLVVFLMAVGAVDFGRMYYNAIAVASAANAGTATSVYSPLVAQDTSETETVAAAALTDIDDATVTAAQICSCPDAPNDFTVDCKTGTCTNYGLPRLYVRTRVEKDFSTFGKYPMIPQDTHINLANWMRVR